MFRIIQFQLPKERLIELAETNRDSVERVQNLVRIDSIDGFFVTEPMATTSAKYFELEQYIMGLFHTPAKLTKDLTGDYRLLRTRAPKAYDYGYCIEIGTMQGEFGEERLVAMPAKSVEYQSGRYMSGMYTPVLID
jgi:hypothetical protein